MKFNLMALLVCFCTMICGTAFAYTPPAPTGYVTDTTGSLSASQVSQLNSKISDFNKRTQNEIAVLVIKSIGDSNIEDVTHDTFKSWRVGKAGLDNGVLLVLAIESRKMRLQTGSGVEGDITDLQSSDILASMKPGLRNKDYYGAISLATDKTMGLLESRHGQKVDPGQGAQFNKPLPATETSTVPVAAAPVAASCAVGTVGAESSDLTWAAGIILFLVLGIVFARFMIRRNARLTMEALERQTEAELAAEAAARIASDQESARLRNSIEAEKIRLVKLEMDKLNLVTNPVPHEAINRIAKIAKDVRTKGIIAAEGHYEADRRAAQAAKAIRTQALVDAAVVGTVVATSAQEDQDESDRKARARRDEERRDEERREEERRAQARREEDRRDEERRAQARRDQEEEDRRRRQREEDDRRSSYSSSSSSDSSWSNSDSGSDSGFGGGDSGSGGSSDSW